MFWRLDLVLIQEPVLLKDSVSLIHRLVVSKTTRSGSIWGRREVNEMRVQPIGMSGTLVIISRRELGILVKKIGKNPSSETCLLLGGRDAPGYAVMVENDKEHDLRPIPGKPRKPQKAHA